MTPIIKIKVRAVKKWPGTKSSQYVQLCAIFMPTLALLINRTNNNFRVSSQRVECTVVPKHGVDDTSHHRFRGVIREGCGDRAKRRAERCPVAWSHSVHGHFGPLSSRGASGGGWCTAQEQGCFKSTLLLSACTLLTMFLCVLSNSCLESFCCSLQDGLLFILIPF